ncbi:SDR family NAD(P)-dependent oxidoreductase [Sphingomonas sp. Y38-1Y]|uniref:SDR family NAD(P)-dependent oxidoreductase n=1 Tax=Sphingomonas sp. Y38-1Y TaxID=3078265 RepID=UPI0028EAB488|nr:SDR family oxidoreductase [Sphingomonas sp. Y38-1Y]
MQALVGKVAIVTGSGRGIGRAVAVRLASEGASVVVNDLDQAPAQAVVDKIRAGGGSAIACNGNVTAPDFGDRVVAAAIDAFGSLDIIVNNAGYTRDGVIQKQSDAQFQAMLDVHVTAPFRILRAAAEPWRALAKAEAAEGREVIRKVVNISSISGVNGNAGQINYAAAKAAVVGMTKTLAKEWGRLKVCVNCVAFGFIETRLNLPSGHPDTIAEIEGEAIRFGVPDSFRDAVTAQIPLGRAGTPEEAAGPVWFFCSPDSDYVSGQTLLVAGGLGV